MKDKRIGYTIWFLVIYYVFFSFVNWDIIPFADWNETMRVWFGLIAVIGACLFRYAPQD